MKRNWKRILSLWLTVCMVFTMNFGLGATAVYANATGTYSSNYNETNEEVTVNITNGIAAGQTVGVSVGSAPSGTEKGENTISVTDNGGGGVTGSVTIPFSQSYIEKEVNVYVNETETGWESAGTVTITAKDIDEDALTLYVKDFNTVSVNNQTGEADIKYAIMCANDTNAPTVDSFNTLNYDDFDGAFNGLNAVLGTSPYNGEKKDDAVVSDLRGEETGTVDLYVYAVINSADATGKVIRLETTLPAIGESGLSAANWSLTKKVNAESKDVLADEATYDAGSNTLTINKQDGKYTLTPLTGAGDIKVKAAKAGVELTVSAIDGAVPSITITEGSQNIKLAGVENESTLLIGAGEAKDITLAAENTIAAAAVNDVILTTKLNNGGNNYDIKDYIQVKTDDPAKFKPNDGWSFIDVVNSNITEDTGWYTINNLDTESNKVYVYSETGLICFNVKSSITAAQKTAIGTAIEKAKVDVEKDSLTYHLTGLPVSKTYNVQISDGAGKAELRELTTDAEGKADIEFTPLEEAAAYPNMMISFNSVMSGQDTLTAGFAIEAAVEANPRTDKSAPVLDSNIYVKDITAKSITLSANDGANVYAALVSANSVENAKKVVGYIYNDNGTVASNKAKFVNPSKEGTAFKKAYSLNADGTDAVEVDLTEKSNYYIATAFTDGTDDASIFLSKPAVLTPEVQTKEFGKVTISARKITNFDYLGDNNEISQNILPSFVSSNNATAGTYEVLAAKLDGDWYNKNLTAEENYQAHPENYKSVDAKDYGTDGGWLSGNYVAIARFVGDGDVYSTTPVTAESTFTINQAKLYMTPVLGFDSVSANEKLGNKFTEKFDYQILNKKGEDTGFAYNGGTVDYIIDGSGKASATWSTSEEGEKKVYVSANDVAKLDCGDNDKGSYILIDYDTKSEAKSATFNVLKMEAPSVVKVDDKTLYYGAYKNIVDLANDDLRKKAFFDYVQVYMGDTNITKDTQMKFLYWNEEKGKLTEDNVFPTTLSANDWIFVSANYVDGNGTDWKSSNHVTIQIEKQPVVVNGKTPLVGARRLSDNLISKYAKENTIEVYNVFDGTVSESAVNTFSKLSDIVTADATVDTTGISTAIATTYPKVEMTLDSSKLDPAFAHNYSIKDAYVESYVISAAFKIDIKSASSGQSIADTQIWDGETALKSYKNYLSDANSFTISVDSVPSSWAFSYGTLSKKPQPITKDSIVTVTPGETDNLWKVDVSRYGAYSNYKNYDLTIYAIYDTAVSNTSGTVKVGAIEPVFYDGTKHVRSVGVPFKKGQSTDLNINVYDANGVELTYTVDYKVSYKNNVNAAYATDKKAPTVVITGLGQYKGLKLNVPFTILPANFGTATITMDKKFIPLTKSGTLKLGEKITIGGKKVSNKNYKLTYYSDADRTQDVTSKLASYYTGTKAVKLYVKATSVATKKAVNFSIGDSKNFSGYIIAYPKGSKSLKVKLSNKGKVQYSDSKKTANVITDFINDTNATITADKTAVKKANLNEDELLFYTDKNLSKEASNSGDYDGKTIGDAGTYYIAVLPDEKTMVSTNVFKPAAVKVTFEGLKISKKLVNLSTNKATSTGVPQTWTLDTQGLELDKDFYLEVMREDGEFDEGYVTTNTVTKGSKYTFTVDKSIDTGLGKYTIRVCGKGKYTGSFKLNYSYTKASITKFKYTVKVNDGNAVTFDPSNQYKNVKIAILDKDNNVKGTGTKANYDTLTKIDSIKSINFSGTKTGKKAGTVTITFKNYSGQLKGTFEIDKLPVKQTDVRAASMYSKDSTPRVYLAREIEGVDYKFTLNKDYKLNNLVINGSTGTVDVEILANSRLTGTLNTVTFPVYTKKVSDIKIASLSTNKGLSANLTTEVDVKYNSSGKYYEYKGRTIPVFPKVASVTAVVDGKTVTVPASNYTVSYKPVYLTDKDGNTTNEYGMGTYKAIITIKSTAGSSYPSYETKELPYTVKEAMK